MDQSEIAVSHMNERLQRHVERAARSPYALTLAFVWPPAVLVAGNRTMGNITAHAERSVEIGQALFDPDAVTRGIEAVETELANHRVRNPHPGE